MDKQYYNQAAAYFAGVWQEHSQTWETQKIEPTQIVPATSTTTPICLSLIARVTKQSMVNQAILSIRNQLEQLAKRQYTYPTDSLHISLQGLTYHSDPVDYPAGRIDRLTKLTSDVLKDETVISFQLKGLSVIGNQIFCQVFPTEHRWEDWRKALVDKALAVDEQPITYPNKAPIHLNLARITTVDKASIADLFSFVKANRNTDFGELKVDCIELVLTDFYVREQTTRSLVSFHLS